MSRSTWAVSQTKGAKVVDGTEIRQYVRDAYVYLAALQKSETPASGAAGRSEKSIDGLFPAIPDQTLTVTFSKTELADPAGLVAPVTVQIEISRTTNVDSVAWCWRPR